MNYNSASKQCELSDRNSTTAMLITAQLTWSHLESNSEQIKEPETNCGKIVEPLTTRSENASKAIYIKTTANTNVSTPTELVKTTPQEETVTAPTSSPTSQDVTTSTSTDSDVVTTESTFSTSRSSTEPSITIDAMEILNKTINVPKFIPNLFYRITSLSVCLWFSAEETKSATSLFNAVNNEVNGVVLNCQMFTIFLTNSYITLEVEKLYPTFKKMIISSNQYYHMCVIREKENATLYLRKNEGERHVESNINALSPGSMSINEIVLGQQTDLNGPNNQCGIDKNNYCFKGNISNVDVWSKALTIDEIEKHYSITDAPFGDIINRTTFMNFTETDEIRATKVVIN